MPPNPSRVFATQHCFSDLLLLMICWLHAAEVSSVDVVVVVSVIVTALVVSVVVVVVVFTFCC